MRFRSSRGIVLKSSRSTRWPYLFRSTVFGRDDDFDCTTWNSPELGGLTGVGDETGTLTDVPLLAKVVFVDVRESGTGCWLGDGVSKDRGFVATAAFHGAITGAIFAARKISGNLATL